MGPKNYNHLRLYLQKQQREEEKIQDDLSLIHQKIPLNLSKDSGLQDAPLVTQSSVGELSASGKQTHLPTIEVNDQEKVPRVPPIKLKKAEAKQINCRQIENDISRVLDSARRESQRGLKNQFKHHVDRSPVKSKHGEDHYEKMSQLTAKIIKQAEKKSNHRERSGRK
mmetsp:Transcript_30815/g.47211  ORF Transcript_30815/g.47211 Transcript_30815/m.47211 type:complete len:168 (+) Transcript_30815:126-629(+)